MKALPSNDTIEYNNTAKRIGLDQWLISTKMCYNALRRDPAFRARLWSMDLRDPIEEPLPDEQF